VNFWADEYFKDKGRLTAETETSLYRITQEALNNIAKYARAEKVEILLKKRGDTAVLMVQDDGTGFDVGAVSNGNSKRLGLIGMRERAGLVRGRFEVESTPGEGTTIYVTVPLAAPASDGAGAITAALS
jgi:signal transduction histidine kinase